MAIRILQWNCRSIRNKILELLSYLFTFDNLPHILCLHETNLNKETFFSLIGYQDNDNKRSK